MLERRALPRAKVKVGVACCVRGRTEGAEIYDLSADGCMIQSSPGFGNAGDKILIRFSDGTGTEGTIIWRNNLNAGVQFSQRLETAERVLSAYGERTAELKDLLGLDGFGRLVNPANNRSERSGGDKRCRFERWAPAD